jgi:hypothetical protein
MNGEEDGARENHSEAVEEEAKLPLRQCQLWYLKRTAGIKLLENKFSDSLLGT